MLTSEQHARLRDYLTALMDYAAWQRDCRPSDDAAEIEAAHAAALDAADALDLLDTAVADMTAMVRDARMPDWLSRVDGSVKH